MSSCTRGKKLSKRKIGQKVENKNIVKLPTITYALTYFRKYYGYQFRKYYGYHIFFYNLKTMKMCPLGKLQNI